MESVPSSCCRQWRMAHHHSNHNKATSSKGSRSMSMYRRKMKTSQNCISSIKELEVSAVAASDIILAANSAGTLQNDLSWEIIVGSLAGVIPFIVAGIEFGKRIMMQKTCDICRGSGLLLKKDYYIRCPNCGGFLPWQSWKRFFTG